MLENAATGSAKNIVPKRLIATSKLSGASVWTWASARRNATLATPAVSARPRATSSIGSERSTPMTLPVRPTVWAAASVVAPQPHPMSRANSPGASSAAARSTSATGARMRSRRSGSATHLRPLSPFHASDCSVLAISVIDP